jgi:flagellar hook-associated protein 3 FlgL
VVNPSALTGNNYTITFSITGGVTKYSVPNSTPPIANADFIEGRPIQFDGISISPRGTPAAGDTISIGPVNTGTLYTDPGTVVNPSALTGNNYKITFSVAGGVTQYTVTKFNMATNPITSTSTTPVTFTSGQAIQFDGISITPKGNPANGDTLSVTPSTPVSLFTVLDNAINSINNSSNNNILRHALDKALSEIDAGMARLQSGRGQAGDMLNQADLIENNQIARTNQIQNDRSRAEDMDMVKGISDYQNQQTAYDAALKTYAQVQRLSLFNYMS